MLTEGSSLGTELTPKDGALLGEILVEGSVLIFCLEGTSEGTSEGSPEGTVEGIRDGREDTMLLDSTMAFQKVFIFSTGSVA